MPLGRFEQAIVVGRGIERRVEVDEVNGFGREVVAQDVEIVAEEKLVHAARVLPAEISGGNS